jgi:hypothetical protein
MPVKGECSDMLRKYLAFPMTTFKEVSDDF